MSYKIGTVTYGTTGLKTINLGATSTPTRADFIVQNKYGVNEGTLRHVSIGQADGSGQRCTSYIKDGSGTSYTYDVTNKCIVVYELSGGTPVVVLEANFDSFTSNGVKINVTVANSAYLIYLRADY